MVDTLEYYSLDFFFLNFKNMTIFIAIIFALELQCFMIYIHFEILYSQLRKIRRHVFPGLL